MREEGVSASGIGFRDALLPLIFVYVCVSMHVCICVCMLYHRYNVLSRRVVYLRIKILCVGM
jgi:hypothetical protein